MEEQTTTTAATTTQTGAITTRKATQTVGRGATLSYPSQTPSTIEAVWCNSEVEQKGWVMTLGCVTINFLSSTRRPASAEYLLLDSGAQLHACPMKSPRQRVTLSDPGFHAASGTRLQRGGGRLVRC